MLYRSRQRLLTEGGYGWEKCASFSIVSYWDHSIWTPCLHREPVASSHMCNVIRPTSWALEKGTSFAASFCWGVNISHGVGCTTKTQMWLTYISVLETALIRPRLNPSLPFTLFTLNKNRARHCRCHWRALSLDIFVPSLQRTEVQYEIVNHRWKKYFTSVLQLLCSYFSNSCLESNLCCKCRSPWGPTVL